MIGVDRPDPEHQIVDAFGKTATYLTPQGAPILSIGPVPADPAASCIENTDPFALKYATKYELWLGADSLSILPLSSVAIEQDLVRFAKMQG